MKSIAMHLMLSFAVVVPALAGTASDSESTTPLATIDLASDAGIAAVKGSWRYSDARIVETTFRAPDSAGQPTGRQWITNDIEPHAGPADFDDSNWQTIEPTSLAARRGTGRVSFNWYRINLTVPDNLAGSSIWFETRLDDYAEVWVDGEIGRQFGQVGGSVVAGWNAPNWLQIARNAKPGQHIQLAIFGMNGPISDAPTNYIFIHGAAGETADAIGNQPFALEGTRLPSNAGPWKPHGRIPGISSCTR